MLTLANLLVALKERAIEQSVAFFFSKLVQLLMPQKLFSKNLTFPEICDILTVSRVRRSLVFNARYWIALNFGWGFFLLLVVQLQQPKPLVAQKSRLTS